jgi:hypothetical protein
VAAAGAARLAATVQQAGPDARVWTWADDQTAGFWLRRMVHETVIHRADAALALRRATEIASDGITELGTREVAGERAEAGSGP